MYPKNAASPPPLYATVVSAADGSPITADVAAYHVQGTTRGAGGGTLTHVANGKWAYTPTQAETDYAAFAIEFYHADAVGDGPVVVVVTENGVVDNIWGKVNTNLDAKVTEAKLAADGLDSITATRPSGKATTFPAMLVQLFYRFFGKATKSATQIKTYAADGTTVVTTQTVSASGDDQTQGEAS